MNNLIEVNFRLCRGTHIGLTFTTVSMVVCDVVKFIPFPWKGEGEGGGSALSGPQGLDPLP
jgi:hypothetical protein